MTVVDTRLPDRWLTDPRYLSLSDPAWRCFTTSLMWCNTHLTDGHIPAPALRVIGYGKEDDVVGELVSEGLWEPVQGGYRCAGDWEADLGQSTAEYVMGMREKARLRQVRRRASNPVTRDNPRDVGEERTGEERVGQVDLAKRCSKCGMKTSSWDADSVPVYCLRCETDSKPL